MMSDITKREKYKNIKNFIKLIFINLTIFLLLFILTDYLCTCLIYYQPQIIDPFESVRSENNLNYDKDKKSIIVSGCSFAYGTSIPYNQNFSYKLQQQTGRKVYNRGKPGYGPHLNLKDIQTSSFYNKDKITEPEYYIYVFISDHIRRLYIDYFGQDAKEIYRQYKIKNHKLIPEGDKITLADYIKITHFVKWLNNSIAELVPDDKKFDRLKLYMYATREELLKRYPDIKMVILVYHPELCVGYNNIDKPFRTDRWKELEDDGFIIIRLDTPEFDYLKETEYLSESDKEHPSGKAWDKIVPVVIEKLGLNK